MVWAGCMPWAFRGSGDGGGGREEEEEEEEHRWHKTDIPTTASLERAAEMEARARWPKKFFTSI